MISAGVLLARIYSPQAFGEYAVYAAQGTLISLLSALRLDQLAFDDQTSGRSTLYYKTSLLVAIATVPLFIMVCKAGSSLTNTTFSLPSSIAFAASNSLYYLGTQYLLHSRQYDKFAKIRLAQSLLYFAVPAVFWIMGVEGGLHLGIAASFFSVGIFVAIRAGVWHESANAARTLFVGRLRAGLRDSVAMGLQYATPFAPIFIGGLFATKTEVGAFFLLSQIVAAPFSFFRRSLVSFFSSELANVEVAKSFLHTHAHQLKRGIVAACVGVPVISAILHFSAPSLIKVALGSSWGKYSAYLVPMLLYYVVDALLQPVTILLPLWGGTRIHFRLEITRFLIVFPIGYLACAILELTFFWFCVFFYCAMSFIYIAEFVAAISIAENSKQGTSDGTS